MRNGDPSSPSHPHMRLAARALLVCLVFSSAACAKPSTKKSEGKKAELALATNAGEPCGSVDIDRTKTLLDCSEPGYGPVPGASNAPFKARLKDDAPEFEQDTKK